MSRWIFGLALVAALGAEARESSAERPAFRSSFNSSGNQAFHMGDGNVACNTLNLACGAADITAAGDIRITIPAGLGITWNTGIGTITRGGTNPTVVTNAVTYADAGRTVVLDTTIDFTGIESWTVSGLQFAIPASGTPGTVQMTMVTQFGGGTDPFTLTLLGNPSQFFSTSTQTFNFGDGPTAMAPIRITDHASVPGILISTDIRITIPAGLNLTWEDTIPAGTQPVTITEITAGTAAKVSTTATVLSTKVIRLNILADFTGGESFEVSGMNFVVGAQSSGQLTCSVNTGNSQSNTDSTTKTIGGAPTIVSAADAYTVGDPSRPCSTITITDAPGVAMINPTDDIRIRIPAGLAMEWDPVGLSETSAKVSAIGLDPADLSNKTLLLTVSSNFAASESFTVTASFINFSSSSAGALQLEVDGDVATEAVTASQKTIGAPTLSSANDQVFQVGQGATTMLAATVQDDVGGRPRITAANDIVIRIPAGFDMDWDADLTGVTIGGTASARINVATPVTRLDAKNLRINVDSNFLSSETVILGGLRFSNFAAPDLPDNLELIVNGGLNTVADLDNRIIAIGGLPTLSSAASQEFTVNDPSTAAGTINLTDSGGVATFLAVNDIFVRIPSGFPMQWNTLIAPVVTAGAGAGTLGVPAFTFLTPAVLRINITADFDPAQTITISGAEFSAFSAAAAPAPLELLVQSGGPVADSDDKTRAIGRPTLAAAANRVYGTGDVLGVWPTDAPTLTITEDATVPRIKLGSDVRVTIPAGLDMTWDAAVVNPTIGLSGAAGAVSGTVTYEGSNKTLVLDVTADFSGDAVLTVSGLRFANFNSEGGPASLQLNVRNAAPATFCHAAAQTLKVSNRPAVLSATTLDSDGNGFIDRLRIFFTEPVNGTVSSVTGGAGFAVAGYAIGYGAYTAPDRADFVLAEKGVPDTGAAPALSYDPATGTMADADGLDMNLLAAFVPADGAAPRIMGFSVSDSDGNGFLDAAVFTFSEPLAAGGEDLGDWRLVDADGVTDLLAGLTVGAVGISGNTVTIALADATGTAGVPRYRFLSDGDGTILTDAALNAVGPRTNNNAPLADAGPTVAGNPNRFVLDGSGSSDADGQGITYAWVQVGTSPAVVTLAGAATPTPSFLARTAGTYQFQLTVDDGLESRTDTVQVTVLNAAPTADAGPDKTAEPGSMTAVLNAMRSADVNGDALTFTWTQTLGPALAPSNIVFAFWGLDLTALSPADQAAGALLEYVLTVSDGVNQSTDVVQVRVVGTSNRPPTADAGPDRVVPVGVPAMLDGRFSIDPDGLPLTYSWTPAALLTGAATATPTFVPPAPGVYVFTLTVVDGGGLAGFADTVTILAAADGNQPPEALGAKMLPAGDVAAGDFVTLDAAGSLDPEGATLRYAWTQVRGPLAPLTGPDTRQPGFVPVMAGEYVFRLVVNDGAQDSLPVLVRVPVKALPGDTLPVAVAALNPAQDLGGGRVLYNGATPIDLDGTGSSPGVSVSEWVQTAGPAVGIPTNFGGYNAFEQFFPPVPGAYEFTLSVLDGGLAVWNSTVLRVVVSTAGNAAPQANAGPDGTGTAGQAVALNATGSTDDTATFGTGMIGQWVQLSGPPVTFSDPTSPTSTFTPPSAGTYVFLFRVGDGTAEGSGDTVTIVVGPAAPAPVGDDDDDDCGLLGLEALLLLALLRSATRIGPLRTRS